jgi:hypothetical protein
MSPIDDYRNYEMRVRQVLEERLRAESSATQVSVFHDRKYPGASGHEHQIDVSCEVVLAGCRILILAECKKYAQRVNISDLLEFVGRLRDIGAHKGIMVTTVGYQEGAMRIAEENGIALIVTPPQGPESWGVILPALLPPVLIELALRPQSSAIGDDSLGSALGSPESHRIGEPIQITWPASGAKALWNFVIHGAVRRPKAAVWIVVNPYRVGQFWVQPPAVVRGNGAWTCEIFIGISGNFNQGIEFDIHAIANPRLQLERGMILSHLPEAEAVSPTVRVVRG